MLHTDDIMEILFWQWQTARIWSKTFGPFVFLQVKDSFNKCYSPLKVELHDTATYSKTQVNVFSEEVNKKKNEIFMFVEINAKAFSRKNICTNTHLTENSIMKTVKEGLQRYVDCSGFQLYIFCKP